MAFGKADTGLLKYTQQAEAAQDPSLALMGAVTMGGIVSQIQKQEAAAAKRRQESSKDFWKYANKQPGNLNEKDKEMFKAQTVDYLNRYNNANDIDKQDIILQYNNIVDNYEAAQVKLDENNANIGNFNESTSYIDYDYQLKLSEGDYETIWNEDTKEMVYRIPKFGSTKPQMNSELKIIQEKINKGEIQVDDPSAENYIGGKNKIKWDEYQDAVNSHESWKALPAVDKYEEFNINNLPTAHSGDIETRSRNQELFANNVIKRTTSTSLLSSNVPNAESISDTYKGSTNNGGLGISSMNYNQRMDLAFGDWSDDNVKNSFAYIFKKGANTDKHPDLYKDLDGNPLQISVNEQEGVFAQYDASKNAWVQGNMIDGQFIVDDEQEIIKGEGSELLLDRWLRGQGTDGTIERDANKDWLNERYSNFMGVVHEDAIKTKQKAHFSEKNQYFEGPEGTEINGGDPIFTNKNDALSAKHSAYTNLKFEGAFPEFLLTGGPEWAKKQKVAGKISNRIDEGSKLDKALQKAFKSHNGIKISLNEGVIKVTDLGDDGDEIEIDFKEGDNAEKIKKYNELKEFMSSLPTSTLSNRGQGDLKKLDNSYNTWDEDGIRNPWVSPLALSDTRIPVLP